MWRCRRGWISGSSLLGAVAIESSSDRVIGSSGDCKASAGRFRWACGLLIDLRNSNKENYEG
jgi:hypothetical protein